ncbi:hypothetical protein BJ508DRAFT_313166 [Ascobolus immersus RN42]|uniref:F-box domain-containing protein n=1 Tax=Ascobolus immersus RN42 TaxID=1160509 RepID=A0A3N4HJS6_ASCIM|nr:hypothetical protein BJ508DRAFT_313166 [Ascobolus immersus RN42]
MHGDVTTRSSSNRGCKDTSNTSSSKKRKRPADPSSQGTKKNTAKKRKSSKARTKGQPETEGKSPLLELPTELLQAIFSHIDNPITYLRFSKVNRRIYEIAKDNQTRKAFSKTWLTTLLDSKSEKPEDYKMLKLFEYIARYLRRHCKTEFCQNKNVTYRFGTLRDAGQEYLARTRFEIWIEPKYYKEAFEETGEEEFEDPSTFLSKESLPDPIKWRNQDLIWDTVHLLQDPNTQSGSGNKKGYYKDWSKWVENLYLPRLEQVTEEPKDRSVPWTVYSLALDIEDVVLVWYMYEEYVKYGYKAINGRMQDVRAVPALGAYAGWKGTVQAINLWPQALLLSNTLIAAGCIDSIGKALLIVLRSFRYGNSGTHGYPYANMNGRKYRNHDCNEPFCSARFVDTSFTVLNGQIGLWAQRVTRAGIIFIARKGLSGQLDRMDKAESRSKDSAEYLRGKRWDCSEKGKSPPRETCAFLHHRNHRNHRIKQLGRPTPRLQLCDHRIHADSKFCRAISDLVVYALFSTSFGNRANVNQSHGIDFDKARATSCQWVDPFCAGDLAPDCNSSAAFEAIRLDVNNASVSGSYFFRNSSPSFDTANRRRAFDKLPIAQLAHKASHIEISCLAQRKRDAKEIRMSFPRLRGDMHWKTTQFAREQPLQLQLSHASRRLPLLELLIATGQVTYMEKGQAGELEPQVSI